MNIVANFIKSAVATAIKNKPAIMTGIAIVSLTTTVVICIKEGPKIKEVVDEKKEIIDKINADEVFSEEAKQNAIKDEILDGVKKVGIPALKIAVAFGITVFAIMGINKAHTAREVAASALLESYKNQIAGYEERLPELVGKNKAEDIRHDVLVESADKMCEKYGTNKEKFKQITYKDKVPMRDDFGNRWVASKEELDRALNYCYSEMIRDKSSSNPGHPKNYADFLEEYFSDVELIAKARNWFFTPDRPMRIETTVYEDSFLNTIGYQVSFKYGAPVDEKKIEGVYD